MKNRIDKIKNFFSDEKFEDLDNKKVLNNINNVYNRAKEEFNMLKEKISNRLSYDKNKILLNIENFNKDSTKNFDYNSINLIEEKNKIQEKLEKDKSLINTKLSLTSSTYNEILKEREEEYKAIYEYLII